MRILSIDGGGYLGLASAAFLAELERHFGTQCHDCFDLFCGTSTGAIIALALAAGRSADDVAKFYEKMGPKVFPYESRKVRKSLRYTVGWFRAQYSNVALQEALKEVFGELRLADIKDRGKFALIAAFNASNGTPRLFKTDHALGLSAHAPYLLRDIALASAAAPTYLPLVELKQPNTNQCERFCDGGVFANSPALLGYAEAVSYLRVPPTDVEILSVATPRATLAERASATASSKRLNRGLWAWRTRITDVMIDATSMIASTAVERIVGALGGGSARLVRITLDRPAGLDLDVATPAATETLHQLGSERGQANDTRGQVAKFFQSNSR